MMALKNILTSKKKQPRHPNRELTMLVSETNYSAMFENQIKEISMEN
jgi:hypothetical protein